MEDLETPWRVPQPSDPKHRSLCLDMLPPEIIEQICTSLQPYNTPSEFIDLLNLRLSCKSLGAKARHSHQQAQFHVRYLYLVPAGIKNLLKVAEHPSGAGKYVQQLTVYNGSAYLNSLGATYLESAISDAEEKNIPQECIPFLTAVVEESFKQEPLVETFLESESFLIDLTNIFRKLPNLKYIKFKGARFPKTPSLFRTYYEYAGPFDFNWKLLLRRSTIGLEDMELSNPSGGDHSRAPQDEVIYAASLAGLNLEKISRYNTPSTLPILRREDIFIPTDMTAPWSKSLKTLHWQINDSDDYHVYQHPSRAASNHPFYPWFMAIGSSLERIELSLSGEIHDTERVVLASMPTLNLPKLVNIRLNDMMISYSSLTETLSNCHHTLRNLRLSNCIVDEPAKSWYLLLKFAQQFLKLAYCELRGTKEVQIRRGFKPHVLFGLVWIDGPWDTTTLNCKRIGGLEEGYKTVKTNIATILNVPEEPVKIPDWFKFWDLCTESAWRRMMSIQEIRKVWGIEVEE